MHYYSKSMVYIFIAEMEPGDLTGNMSISLMQPRFLDKNFLLHAGRFETVVVRTFTNLAGSGAIRLKLKLVTKLFFIVITCHILHCVS